MRLIDADELKTKASKMMFEKATGFGSFDAVGVLDIDAAPTIDPETLRPTAKWDDLGDGACGCSACGEDGTVWMFGDTFDYCPECGARMVNDDE